MGALDVALRGLSAARLGIDLAAENSANVGTEGYARRRLELRPASTTPVGSAGYLGGGVDIVGTRRVADDFLEQRLNTLSAANAYADALSIGLAELEGSLPEPGPSGVGAAISDLLSEALALTANPDEAGARLAFAGAADGLGSRLQQVTATIDRFAIDQRTQVRDLVSEVNTLTAEMSELNQEIVKASASGFDVSGMVDRRTVVARDLQELVGGQISQDSAGRTRLFVAGEALVSATGTVELRLRETGTAVEVVAGSGARAMDLTSGKLGGALELNQVIAPDLQAQLDDFARALIKTYDAAHSTGVGLAGGFTELIAERFFVDPDTPAASGTLGTRLGDSDARIPVDDGQLTVTIEDEATGELTTTRLAVGPNTLVGDFVSALNGVSGLTASLVQGKLRLQADPGSKFSFTPSLTTKPDASAINLQPTVSGRYSGDDNDAWTVTILGGGTVGLTAGLQAEVRDGSGAVLRQLDLGPGYVPGTKTDPVEGVAFSFPPGTLNPGDEFQLEVTGAPDSAGVLTAFGINTLFSGTSAADLRVREELLSDSSLLATSRSTGVAGADTLGAELLAAAGDVLDETGKNAADSYGQVVGDLARARAEALNTLEGTSGLLGAVEARREALSGVSIDEEAADLVKLQRAYQANAKVIQTVQTLDSVLFNLI